MTGGENTKGSGLLYSPFVVGLPLLQIVDVQARGAGPEAKGDQKDCLPSRLVSLAWLLWDFATNRHE